MKILVTYKSKTGFTKKYAEMIAKEVDGCLVEFKKMTAEKMSEFDVVVYGGGIYAGMIISILGNLFSILISFLLIIIKQENYNI